MNRSKILYLAALVFLGVCFIKWRRQFAEAAVVFAYAATFSLLLAPLCIRLEKLRFSSGTAAGISILSFLLILAILISVFVPYFVAQCSALVLRIAPVITEIMESSEGWYAAGEMIKNASVSETMIMTAGTLTSALAKWSAVLAAQAGKILFALVITYYFLRERKVFSMNLLLCIPLAHRRRFMFLLSGCRNAVLGYLSGMLKTSVFVTAATFLGLRLLGIQNAFLFSLIMGIMELVPYIGPIVASVPILLSCLAYGGQKMLMVFGVIILVQQMESNFVGPYFASSSTSIHPLTALIGAYVFGNLAGIWGIVLAVPLIVTAKSIVYSIRQFSAAEKLEKSFVS